MKNIYRLNVRFDLDDPVERKAAEFLNAYDGKSRNRFIVDAVTDAIHRNDGRDFTLTDIQMMFREELQAVSIVSPAAPMETSEEATENEIRSAKRAAAPGVFRRRRRIGHDLRPLGFSANAENG